MQIIACRSFCPKPRGNSISTEMNRLPMNIILSKVFHEAGALFGLFFTSWFSCALSISYGVSRILNPLPRWDASKLSNKIPWIGSQIANSSSNYFPNALNNFAQTLLVCSFQLVVGLRVFAVWSGTETKRQNSPRVYNRCGQYGPTRGMQKNGRNYHTYIGRGENRMNRSSNKL